jgi:hypothetical protein
MKTIMKGHPRICLEQRSSRYLDTYKMGSDTVLICSCGVALLCKAKLPDI